MSDRKQLQTDRLILFPERDLLTVNEVADLTRLPVKSCYTRLGDIAVRLAPRTLRWWRTDVMDWLESKGPRGRAA
jgi:predicted DNA-binding transcriptional regulator AlpA